MATVTSGTEAQDQTLAGSQSDQDELAAVNEVTSEQNAEAWAFAEGREGFGEEHEAKSGSDEMQKRLQEKLGRPTTDVAGRSEDQPKPKGTDKGAGANTREGRPADNR